MKDRLIIKTIWLGFMGLAVGGLAVLLKDYKKDELNNNFNNQQRRIK